MSMAISAIAQTFAAFEGVEAGAFRAGEFQPDGKLARFDGVYR